MKFRFRYTERKRPFSEISSKSLRLAGKNTLTPLKKLPVPLPQIDLEDEKKPDVARLSELRAKLKKACTLLSEKILTVYKWIYQILKRIFFSVSSVVERLLLRFDNRKRYKEILTLPMLLGTLTASLLVCTVTAAYMVFGLFAPYMRAYETVTVPSLLGKAPELSETDAKSFSLSIKYENNPDVADGVVISQSPSPGVTRRIYGKDGCCNILITVSRHEKATVPEGIVGSSGRDALLLLKNLGLNCILKEEYSVTADPGRVIGVYPRTGSVLNEGDTVTLTVSLGKETEYARVPKLVGLSETEAAEKLRTVGLSVGKISYERSEYPVGTVISQSDPAYSRIPEGSAVSIAVSGGMGYS